MKAVANISPPLTYDMHFRIQREVQTVKDMYNKLVEQGWKFYVVSQSCGRCYYAPKVITIPDWAYNRKVQGYFTWYISHEMSHAVSGHAASHGKVFQENLIRICPGQYCHFELNYKPSAVRAQVLSGMCIPDDL